MSTQTKDMPDFSFDDHSPFMTITVPEAFNYNEMLHYLSRSPLEIMHHVEKRKVYKLLKLDEELLPVEISEKDRTGIQIRFFDRKLRNAAVCELAVEYVREWFDIKRDLAPFYQLAESDPLLGRLTSDYFGLRIVGVPDLFEALCWAVIGQQVNLPFAYKLKKRFVESFGRSFQWNDRIYWLFPKPEDVAGLTVDELKRLQFTGKKAEYIIDIAGLMDRGSLSKETLLAPERGSADYKAAESRLTAIRGIGPWTAHYVLMRCLRDPSAFPIGDAALQNALKLQLDRLHKPDAEEIRRIFAPWQGWEAYAVFYLWRSLGSAQ